MLNSKMLITALKYVRNYSFSVIDVYQINHIIFC